jgi:pentatricopeptide repeat protein
MPHVAALGLVVAAVVAAYANATGGALVFDARVLVAQNPVVRAWSAENVWFALTHDYWQPMATDGLYRPLTVLSFMFDRGVLGYGDRALGYAVENVALHAGCAMLVYALVWHLVRRRWPATVAALLFALHPVATEAVTNVVGRADLLAVTGVLAGVLCWAKGRAATGGRRVAWASGLVLASVLAFFSKESGLVLVAALVLYDLAYASARRRLRAEHVAVGLVLAGYLAARWYVDRTGLPREDVSPVDNPMVEASFLAARLTALGVLVRAAGLIVWPATLSVDYSYRQIPIVGWPPAQAGDWLALVGLVALPAAVWAVVRGRRRDPVVFFLGALALVGALPSSNLVRLISSIMAERFLYLPLVGIAGLVAVLADRRAVGPRRRAMASAAIGAVLLAAGVRTAVRNLDWRDEPTLWAATVRAAPDSAKAHKAYAGATFRPDADPATLALVVARAEHAVTLRPDYQQALVDLASYEITLGDAVGTKNGEAARRWYEKALTALEAARALDARSTARFVEKMRARGHADETIPDVGDGVLYNNLALVCVKLGELDRALEVYDRMRRLAPLRGGLYRDIAAIEAALGRTDDAAVALFQAIAIDEQDADAKQRLADLYRGFPGGDAPIIAQGEAGDVQIHTSHPTVRGHRCRALRELAAIFQRARLFQAAAQARDQAAACGPG